jgi:hypothetical protein
MQKPVVGVYLDQNNLQVGMIEDYKLVDRKDLSLDSGIQSDLLAEEIKNSVDTIYSKNISHIGFCLGHDLDTDQSLKTKIKKQQI